MKDAFTIEEERIAFRGKQDAETMTGHVRVKFRAEQSIEAYLRAFYNDCEEDTFPRSYNSMFNANLFNGTMEDHIERLGVISHFLHQDGFYVWIPDTREKKTLFAITFGAFDEVYPPK